jgi:hypothetical protein
MEHLFESGPLTRHATESQKTAAFITRFGQFARRILGETPFPPKIRAYRAGGRSHVTLDWSGPTGERVMANIDICGRTKLPGRLTPSFYVEVTDATDMLQLSRALTEAAQNRSPAVIQVSEEDPSQSPVRPLANDEVGAVCKRRNTDPANHRSDRRPVTESEMGVNIFVLDRRTA